MPSPDGKKHLPVLGSSKPEDSLAHSPWVWVLYGGIVSVSVWVPLALMALFLGRKVTAHWAAGNPSLSLQSPLLVFPTAALVMLSFAGACTLGGLVVGKFAEHPRRWDAVMAGVLGALIVLFFAALGNALKPPLAGVSIALSLLLIACPTAALGGRWGRKHRAQNPNGTLTS
jgi:hypothetical protein